MEEIGRLRGRLTEVEEELDEDVESEFVVASEMLEVETPDDEEDGEDDESAELNRLASDGINECYCSPISGNGTSSNENAVSGSEVVEDLVNSWAGTVSD